jgi:hypothetical protein
VKKVHLIFAAMLLTTAGCTHTEMLSPEHLVIDSDRDIMVETKDGRTIRFRSGEYRVTERNYWTVQGRGRLIVDKQTGESRDFEGEITLAEIQDITTIKATTVGKVAFIAIGSSILVTVLFFYALSHGVW